MIHQGTFPLLYVPDLANTVLSEAIKDGMQVGNSGTEYIIPTPLLKDIVGIERLKVSLPEGELETCSIPPLDFVTKCQPTPFNLQLLTSALKDMRKENPELQYWAGDDWPSNIYMLPATRGTQRQVKCLHRT